MLVHWFRDGAPLESSEVVRITRIDPVTSVLAISSLTASMAGNYTCVAKNEVAMVEEAAVLVVRGLYSGLHLVALTSHMVQGRSLGTGSQKTSAATRERNCSMKILIQPPRQNLMIRSRYQF